MRLVLLAMILILPILAIGSFLGPDSLKGCKSEPDSTARCRKADVIIAVSGGDTAARTNEAIRLYKAGWAPLLVFSGAAQDASGPSNAAVMKAEALQAGVPESAIRIEEGGRTTGQNAENVRVLLDGERPTSIIVVTSGYHQRRASLEFGKYFEGASVRSHPVKQDRHWSAWWFMTPRGWYLAGGEIVKIAVWYAGGARE